MSDIQIGNIETEEELTENQSNIKTSTKIHRILDKLFNTFSNSEAFKEKFRILPEGDERSLLLTILKDPIQGIDIHEIVLSAYNNKDVVRFGAKFTNNILEQFMPEQLTSFTVQCIMDQDIFIDLLLGKDKYGERFDIDNAWGRKWIGFEGENWLIHKEMLADMFEEFRHLLNIKSLFK